MYLPTVFQRFKKDFPEIIDASERMGDLCSRTGPLDEKSKHLIQLGIAMGAASKGGVRSHARQALQAGATRDELLHAVLIGNSTVGFPAMIAAYGWVTDVLEADDSPD